MNPQLLAELELDPQVILFLIVGVFSFLKWLFDNLTAKSKGKSREERASELEELYDQYREEIQHRQTQAPPPLPEQQGAYFEVIQNDTPPPLPAAAVEQVEDAYSTPEPSTPLYTPEDIQRAQLIKQSSALTKEPAVTKVTRRKKTQASSSIKQMLRNKGSLKKAIILQEVLGEPKALK